MEKKQNSHIFEQIYCQNIDALFRFVLFRVSNKDEAIDIAEEAFVRLWKEMNSKGVKKLRAFLYKITRNLIIDWYRKQKSIPINTFRSDDDEEEIALDMFASTLPDSELLLAAKFTIEAIG